MNLDRLYVAICTPKEEHLTPYVYGLFLDAEYAQEHFDQHGDKDATLRCTREPVIHRPTISREGTFLLEPGEKVSMPVPGHTNRRLEGDLQLTANTKLTVGALTQLLAIRKGNTPVYIESTDDHRLASLDTFSVKRGRSYTSPEGKHSVHLPGNPPVYTEVLILTPKRGG